jgi:uncharacterized membrane protein (DUF4010 family)
VNDSELLPRIALALAIGLAVGTERGWQKRGAPEGARVAGIRTFAILGLLGGLLGALAPIIGGLGIGLAFIALVVLFIAANIRRFVKAENYGITTEVAAFATTALGIMAVQGSMIITAASATVMVALLDMKPRLHEVLTRIEPMELKAGIQLALLSIVVLPLLPNRGIGPDGVLNPYIIWWLVVIVAAISFAGYTAVRIAGQRFGLLITGFFAGLVSSTALTVSLSRRTRQSDIPEEALAAGIAMGTGTMFVRLLALVGAVDLHLGLALAPCFISAAFTAYAASFVLTRKAATVVDHPATMQNPLDLTTALLFGLLLALITVLTHYVKIYMGDTGIYTLAAVGGLADVDAISLSLANTKNLAFSTVALAIVIAAFVNTGSKIALAAFFGSPHFALMVSRVVLPALALAAAMLTLTP